MSGRQLFMIDKFRDTGRPLLAVMADPEHIFLRALARFKNRSLYANVVNDRTVTYYTAGISKTDPFADMDAVDCNYIEGYAPVILDGRNPVALRQPETLDQALVQRLSRNTRMLFGKIPITAFLLVFVPVGTTIFLLNSAIQSVRSSQRIRLHQQGRAGIDVGEYRIPLLNDMRQEMEDMYENMNNAHNQEYLPAGDEEAIPQRAHIAGPDTKTVASEKVDTNYRPEFPVLALTADQFEMIDALNNVGFNKYPVYIHKHRHSHAAIILRRTGPAFEEGRVVIKHWLDTFEL